MANSANFLEFFLTWQVVHRWYAINDTMQRGRKVVSDSLRLLNFAIRIVIFVLNLSEGQVLFFGKIQITEGL